MFSKPQLLAFQQSYLIQLIAHLPLPPLLHSYNLQSPKPQMSDKLNMKKKKTQQQASPCKPSPPKPTPKQQKLTQQFIMKVLAEQQKCRKQMTQQSILSLINMYKKLVEFYSTKQDTIALYFTEKMQNIMACQGAIEAFDKSREAMTMSMVEEQAQAIKLSDFKEVIPPTTGSYDREVKRKERAKKVQIFMEVKKTQKRSNAKNILNKYYEECVENNLLVMNQLNIQRKNLEDRLKAIHQRSLHADADKTYVYEHKDSNSSAKSPGVLSIYIN